MDVKYPTGHWLNGHFRAVGQTTGFAPAAGAILMAMRWSHPHKFCVIERLTVSVAVNSPIAAQLIDPLALSVQRGYTKSEQTGILSFLPKGISNSSFLAMGGNSVEQLVVCLASPSMGGGVRVADPFAIGIVDMGGLGAAGTSAKGEFIQYGALEHFPLILSKDEGLLVTWGSNLLASGQIVFTCQVSWAEVSN
jgi:hypothetical protein